MISFNCFNSRKGYVWQPFLPYKHILRVLKRHHKIKLSSLNMLACCASIFTCLFVLVNNINYRESLLLTNESDKFDIIYQGNKNQIFYNAIILIVLLCMISTSWYWIKKKINEFIVLNILGIRKSSIIIKILKQYLILLIGGNLVGIIIIFLAYFSKIIIDINFSIILFTLVIIILFCIIVIIIQTHRCMLHSLRH